MWPDYYPLLDIKLFGLKDKLAGSDELGQVFGHNIKGSSLSSLHLSNFILSSTCFFFLIFTKALISCLQKLHVFICACQRVHIMCLYYIAIRERNQEFIAK